MTTDLQRGCVVWFGERGEYTAKLRPGVVVQRSVTLSEAPSITLCGITSETTPSHAARIGIAPSAENGLEKPSFVMIDKITSISRGRIRRTMGKLGQDEMRAVDVALRRWLEL